MLEKRQEIKLHIMLTIFMLTISQQIFAESIIKIFHTQQSAKELLSSIAPLYSQSAQFTAKNNKLIVKASPQILFEIEKILQEIDQPQRNLLIEVSSPYNQSNNHDNNGIAYNTPYSNSYYNSRSNSNFNPNNRIHINHTRRKNSRNEPAYYKLRAVEGQWSTIQTGKRVPYYNVQGGRNNPWQINTQLVDVSSGFEVFPILNGNLVTLKIRPKNNSMDNRHPGWIETRSLDTSISGKLGEWIYLGGAMTEVNKHQTEQGLGYNSADRGRDGKFNARRYSTRRTSDIDSSYSIRVNTID